MEPPEGYDQSEGQDNHLRRIELTWPGKGRSPLASPDGKWELLEPSTTKVQYPLYLENREGNGESLVVAGKRLEALSTLRRTLRHGVKVVYADLPRIEIDDQTRAFRSASDQIYSTYLSVIREHFRAVMPL